MALRKEVAGGIGLGFELLFKFKDADVGPEWTTSEHTFKPINVARRDSRHCNIQSHGGHPNPAIYGQLENPYSQKTIKG